MSNNIRLSDQFQKRENRNRGLIQKAPPFLKGGKRWWTYFILYCHAIICTWTSFCICPNLFVYWLDLLPSLHNQEPEQNTSYEKPLRRDTLRLQLCLSISSLNTFHFQVLACPLAACSTLMAGTPLRWNACVERRLTNTPWESALCAGRTSFASSAFLMPSSFLF